MKIQSGPFDKRDEFLDCSGPSERDLILAQLMG
jgi:hypothetical protein